MIDDDSRQYKLDTHRILNRYKLDTRFIIKDGKKHKCAVICPGGGYSMICSFIEGTPIARKLNEKGISCIIVYYRVGKKALYPNAVDDLARAIKEAMANADKWNLDMSDYSIWGSSAGGHLAACMGTSNMGYKRYNLPKPGAMMLSYPVITLDKAFTHMETRDNFIGKDASLEQEIFASVDKQMDKDYPPTYVWCGDSDTVVQQKNTEIMVDALRSSGVPYITDLFHDVVHGVGPGIGCNAEGWIDKAVSFWLEQSTSK